MKTKLFTLLLAVAASIGTMLASVTIDGIAYNLNETELTAEVTSGGSYSGSIVIPASVSYEAKTYSIASIGDNAFYGCSGLTSIEIPNSVTSIGYGAFYGCSGLTAINVATDNPNYCSLEGVLFNKDKTTLIQYPLGKQGEYIIPNSVTSIGYEAFRRCSGLTSVTIPNSVTSIGSDAFDNCRGLTAVHITDIAAWCSILFMSGGSNPLSYAHNLYFNDDLITNLIIPNSVTSIGNMAFYCCTGLTSVTIPSSVTSIGHDAFSYCTGLTSVTIPNSVIDIGMRAFYYCIDITSVEIPNSVISIGDGAFEMCTGLTSVTIPDSVTSIGYRAFNLVPNIVYNGEATGSPWGAKSINGYVDGYLVYNDESKTNLKACSSQASGALFITNTVINIRSSAFYYCTGLTSVTIPNSVTSIGYNAFRDCTGLTSITCEAITPPSLGMYAFDGIDSPCTLYVPEESIEAYQTADQWKDFTNILPLPLPDKQLWPVILDAQKYEEWQEYVIRDFRANNIDNFLYLWDDTYTFNDVDDSNFYNNDNGGYLSTTVGNMGRAGLGIHINNTTSLSSVEKLRQAIVANPQDYYLHLAIKSTDNACHAFSIMNLDRYYYIVLGDHVINDGTVYQDFERDGQWQEFYLPMTLYADALESTTFESGNFIFAVVSEGIAGAKLNLDAVYFCNTAFKTATADDSTAIEDVQTNPSQSTKIFRNGQILILRGDKVYTVDGRLVR